MTEKKFCNKCEQILKRDDFYSYTRKGKHVKKYMNICKTCHKEYTKQYAKKNKYYRKNNAELCKQYRKKHKETYNESKRKYMAKRRKEDITFRMQDNISTQVYKWCKKNMVTKTNSFWESCKYTPEVLRKHLEDNFWYGMNWDNYGDWHIDHIIPKSKYNILEYGDKQFHECWGLDNLQPLWAEDNLIKGDKIYS